MIYCQAYKRNVLWFHQIYPKTDPNKESNEIKNFNWKPNQELTPLQQILDSFEGKQQIENIIVSNEILLTTTPHPFPPIWTLYNDISKFGIFAPRTVITRPEQPIFGRFEVSRAPKSIETVLEQLHTHPRATPHPLPSPSEHFTTISRNSKFSPPRPLITRSAQPIFGRFEVSRARKSIETALKRPQTHPGATPHPLPSPAQRPRAISRNSKFSTLGRFTYIGQNSQNPETRPEKSTHQNVLNISRIAKPCKSQLIRLIWSPKSDTNPFPTPRNTSNNFFSRSYPIRFWHSKSMPFWRASPGPFSTSRPKKSSWNAQPRVPRPRKYLSGGLGTISER